MVHQVSTTSTLQHNGVVERKIRTLLEMVSVILRSFNQSAGFLDKALLTSKHVQYGIVTS